MSTVTPETYKSRLRQYQRREHLTIWIGAGLAGLVALATGDAFNNAPNWLKAVEITLIVASALLLAVARVNFEWAATLITREIEDGKCEKSPLPENMQKWPEEAEDYWNASLGLLIFAGLTMLACFWWPVLASG